MWNRGVWEIFHTCSGCFTNGRADGCANFLCEACDFRNWGILDLSHNLLGILAIGNDVLPATWVAVGTLGAGMGILLQCKREVEVGNGLRLREGDAPCTMKARVFRLLTVLWLDGDSVEQMY
jgi:hypothetical protein